MLRFGLFNKLYGTYPGDTGRYFTIVFLVKISLATFLHPSPAAPGAAGQCPGPLFFPVFVTPLDDQLWEKEFGSLFCLSGFFVHTQDNTYTMIGIINGNIGISPSLHLCCYQQRGKCYRPISISGFQV